MTQLSNTDQDLTDRRRGPRRPRRVITLVLATAAITAMTTVGAMAGSSMFTDVDAGDTHEESIGWMAQSGVTSGCTSDEYCPDDEVTRAQMATFMQRLAGQADGVDPSVDAAELEGLSLNEVIAAAQDSMGPDLWAVVDADDSSTELDRGNGATDASGGVGTAGRFTVTFDQDVSACSYQATAEVAESKDDANVAEVRPGSADDRVDVWVTNTDTGWVNAGFHLRVIC
ncbi:MAG: S-layer homology domain-containing protein [Nitriliruptoraceae bacterium]